MNTDHHEGESEKLFGLIVLGRHQTSVDVSAGNQPESGEELPLPSSICQRKGKLVTLCTRLELPP